MTITTSTLGATWSPLHGTNDTPLSVSVGFGLRRAGGKWNRLAADDSPPYRAFVDPAKFRKNEKLELIAVVRGLDGSTATSKVVNFAVHRR